MKSVLAEKNVIQLDRRAYERFKVIDTGIVLYKQQPIILGKIIDISRSGLAFCYRQAKDQNFDDSEINIIRPPDFCLDIQQFESVDDFAIQDGAMPNSSKYRRHNVKFGELRGDQMERLEYFLDFYTFREQRWEN